METDHTTFYKALNFDGVPLSGGGGAWRLPTARGPGRWMAGTNTAASREHGYEVCTLEQLPYWLGPVVYEAEIRGERVDRPAKCLVESVRLVRRLDGWNERTTRLFIADCAERLLPLYVARYPHDTRLHDAIAATRAYARRETGYYEFVAAVRAIRTAHAAMNAAYDNYLRETIPGTDERVAMSTGAALEIARMVVDAVRGHLGVAVHTATDEAALAWQSRRLAHYFYDDCAHGAGDCPPVVYPDR